MRSLYLVSYDICSDRRLRKVYRIMNGYGDPVQYSIFVCELSRREKAELQDKLGAVLNCAEDQVLIVHLGPAAGHGTSCFETLGKALAPGARRVVVV